MTTTQAIHLLGALQIRIVVQVTAMSAPRVHANRFGGYGFQTGGKRIVIMVPSNPKGDKGVNPVVAAATMSKNTKGPTNGMISISGS